MIFARRILVLLMTLLVAGLGGAALLRLAPGSTADERELDTRLSAQSLDALAAARREGSSPVRFYARYLGGLARGDLGVSHLFGRPVVELLRERLPLTLKTVLAGFALAWVGGLMASAAAATARGGTVPFVIGGLVTALLCVPSALAAVLLYRWEVPAAAGIAAVIFPKVFFYSNRLFRVSIGRPHVLAARARGLSEARVFLCHAVPPVAGELLALVGVTLALGLSAAIPLEVILDLPGVGQLAWKAALGRDLPLLVSLTLLIGAFTLIANTAAETLSAETLAEVRR
jgi:ABC-type dipeptide/oligopeptide/nickel transport system permease component